MRTAAVRGCFFLALWLALMPSLKPADLAVGLVATFLATWASLALLPPATGRFRAGALLAYLPRFVRQSVVAGFDVARRALDPRLPLKPGYVTYPTRLPPGRARNEFASISSLLPGSVPCGDDPGGIEFHCLDATQPVVEQAAAEENALSAVLAKGERHA